MSIARSSKQSVVIQEETEVITFTEEEIETVPVTLLKDLVLKTTGEVTKNLYVFNGAGSTINIDKRDINGIIKKNEMRKSCCGSNTSPYFEIL